MVIDKHFAGMVRFGATQQKITFQLYTYIYIYAYTCVCQSRTWTNRANQYELRHVHNSLSQENIMFYDCTRVSDRNLWCHFPALRCNTCHCYNCELWRSRPCVDISFCIIHSSHIWIVSVGTNRIEGDRKLSVHPFIHPSVYLSAPPPPPQTETEEQLGPPPPPPPPYITRIWIAGYVGINIQNWNWRTIRLSLCLI